MTEDQNSLRQVKAAELEALAQRTGDRAFAKAAETLRTSRGGTPGRRGRRAIDDTRALQLVAGLLASGAAKSLHDAAALVAMMTAPRASWPAVRDRLRRKTAARIKSDQTFRATCYPGEDMTTASAADRRKVG